MILSNSLPIQFWVNGQETFNEKDVCGITPVCWCQPFQCDDEIRIQFIHETNRAYKLKISNSNDDELVLLPFTQISDDYTFTLSFIPSEEGICNEQVYFSIIYTVEDVLFQYFYEQSESLPQYLYEQSENLPNYFYENSEL